MSKLEGVDAEIYGYITDDNPKSFLLFAGAGSGKTRTLVNLLQEIKEKRKSKLIEAGQKVAIITFTNAACEEINHRLQYDSTFSVSTIHSFAWDMIKPFSDNIREWLKIKLEKDIGELEKKVETAKTEETRNNYEKKIDKKRMRLGNLPQSQNFIYSPTELLTGLGALNHAEVIAICADFLANYPLMQKILIHKYPIVFIDECQDTQTDLLLSLINTQQSNKGVFVLGLFGDLMQQIYSGGYSMLTQNLPSDWMKPSKIVNYRSPKRIVELINKIRVISDAHEQETESTIQGFVRLFIAENTISDKLKFEQHIREKMNEVCSDSAWVSQENVKTLVLEHRMAAKRAGFYNFYEPLAKNDKLRDDILQRTGANISFLLLQFLPLIVNVKGGNHFGTMRILEKFSPLMKEENIAVNIPLARGAILELEDKIKISKNLCDLLDFIHEKRLLELPSEIEIARSFNLEEAEQGAEDEKIYLWSQALNASLDELEKYNAYIEGSLGFDTHQGVKGLEFPRVMAILDDEDANGFLFKYNKLFGSEGLSKTDQDNIKNGKDNVLSRTARLFYVICSRSQGSLAIVIYSNNPEGVKKQAISSQWFNEEEVIILSER